MIHTVIIRPSAKHDLSEAKAWYRNISAGDLSLLAVRADDGLGRIAIPKRLDQRQTRLSPRLTILDGFGGIESR